MHYGGVVNIFNIPVEPGTLGNGPMLGVIRHKAIVVYLYLKPLKISSDARFKICIILSRPEYCGLIQTPLCNVMHGFITYGFKTILSRHNGLLLRLYMPIYKDAKRGQIIA